MNPPPRGARLPTLPELVDRKLYKTGQTRGATVREIYQNRVGRNSTVLIPFAVWDECRVPDDGSGAYENGFIVLVDPGWYFTSIDAERELDSRGVRLGTNALLLFQQRSEWRDFALADGDQLPNGEPFAPATSRVAPLGGTYLARVHSTTAAEGGEAVVRGYNQTSLRGAGIRVYEYASSQALADTRLQLEALFWHCHDSTASVLAAGMSRSDHDDRMRSKLTEAMLAGLLDYDRLQLARMLDDQRRTICPLCLNLISADEFMRRGEQAEGRMTWDNTITEVSLFHIEELRVGKLQHKPYNLGWGHHFCNVVVKDAGIIPTLRWMKGVLENNGDSWAAIDEAEESVEQGVDL